MNNEELKKKIVEILVNCKSDECAIEYCSECDGNPCIENCREKQQADALIAAGIGDVSELKKHRVIVEQSPVPTDDNCYILPNTSPIIKQLYSGKEVEQIAKERDEYKHRAEVAERELERYTVLIKPLEAENARLNHLAARAERALDKAVELAYEYRTEADTLSCSSCPMGDELFPKCKDRGLYKECSKRWKEQLIEQAERELAEEGENERP